MTEPAATERAETDRVMGVLLAAGQSRRFGDSNKLLADYGGRALCSYAARAVATSDCFKGMAITSDLDVSPHLAPLSVEVYPQAQAALSASVKRAVQMAQTFEADFLLMVLADMPLITTSDLNIIIRNARESGLSCATDGQRRLPPACFSRVYFDELSRLEWDKGASDLLPCVPVDALHVLDGTRLSDVDTGEDLAALRLTGF